MLRNNFIFCDGNSYTNSCNSECVHFFFFITFSQKSKIYFPLKPNSILDLVYKNVWSQELENVVHVWPMNCCVRFEAIGSKPTKRFSFSKLYSLVLTVLANDITMKHQFWISLKEKGFYTDEETHLTISPGFYFKGLQVLSLGWEAI